MDLNFEMNLSGFHFKCKNWFSKKKEPRFIKLKSVFHASVLLLTINFVITLLKYCGSTNRRQRLKVWQKLLLITSAFCDFNRLYSY